MQYVKIKDIIVEQIASGMLQPNQKLPPERKLAESFDTTRVTLREALSVLEAEGKIYREDRRGWFIASRPLSYNPASAQGFHDLATAQGRAPTTEILLAKRLLASKQAADLLQLPPFTDVYQIEQLRYLDGRPVAKVIHFIRADLFPNLLEFELEKNLSELFIQQYGVKQHQVKYRISTTSLLDDTATSLRATAGSPSIVIERIHYDSNGGIIDARIESWRHDAISIEATHEMVD